MLKRQEVEALEELEGQGGQGGAGGGELHRLWYLRIFILNGLTSSILWRM
jgi:hypothetical protein